jgi:transcriptional regulator with XRE-family HTH domain
MYSDFAMPLRRPEIEEQEHFSAIATQITERREAWGLSQRELAELCGTTQSAIARLERGRRPPRIDTLLRVADALDCELVVELRRRTVSTERGGTS